jgi:hypothetical protein
VRFVSRRREQAAVTTGRDVVEQVQIRDRNGAQATVNEGAVPLGPLPGATPASVAAICSATAAALSRLPRSARNDASPVDALRDIEYLVRPFGDETAC